MLSCIPQDSQDAMNLSLVAPVVILIPHNPTILKLHWHHMIPTNKLYTCYFWKPFYFSSPMQMILKPLRLSECLKQGGMDNEHRMHIYGFSGLVPGRRVPSIWD